MPSLCSFTASPERSGTGDSVRSKFYGFPIARVTVLYLAAQLVLSLVFMATAQWVPGWVPLVLDILLLAAALVGFVAADAMRDEVERQDARLKVDVAAMRSLQSLAAALPGQCEDEAAAAALKALSEEFRFSDPRSSEALADVESDLSACMDELQRAVVDGDNETAMALCKKESLKLAERNRLCKLGK